MKTQNGLRAVNFDESGGSAKNPPRFHITDFWLNLENYESREIFTYETREMESSSVYFFSPSSSRSSDIFHQQLSAAFIKCYQEFVKNSFPSYKVEGCSEFAGECHFALNFFAFNNHCHGVHITDELGGNALKNALFSGFDIHAKLASCTAVENRYCCAGIYESRCIDALFLMCERQGNNRIVSIAEELVREFHRMLISSSFLGTFITITSSSFMSFLFSMELTSESESAEATIPSSITATHLPLCFSTSLGCKD